MAWLCLRSRLMLKEPPLAYDLDDGGREEVGLIGRWWPDPGRE